MYIDNHCHIFSEYYKDIDRVIKEANDNKVNVLVLSGCSKKDILEGLEIIKKHKNVYMTIGFHPDEVDNTNDEDISWLENLIKTNDKIVGIGEIGLDYHWVKDNKDKQIELFEKQLQLAEKLNYPIVIHTRDATDDTIKILKKYQLKGIIHCFSGSIETAREYLKLGYNIGIGGVITFKNTNLKETIKEIPIEKITLETDSPYLAPTPHRGEDNSPKYIPLIAEEIAKQKELSTETVEKITSSTSISLFDLHIQ
ncbi:MAG: TatD family hydrolase [Bacilli bacterium]|nr:TatD family hydrolase [Bacilli bacterium]